MNKYIKESFNVNLKSIKQIHKQKHQRPLMSIYSICQEMKKKMISNRQYVNYSDFGSSEEVREFLNDKNNKVHCSSKNFKSDIEKILNYKDAHRKNYKTRAGGKNPYKNKYAHGLKIMIPLEISSDSYEEFVNRAVQAINANYKRLLFVYKIIKEGDGTYAYIMLFARWVYKKSRNKPETYKRDYYYNAKKQMCKKTDPGAVLIHKKGDTKRDDQGKVIMQQELVQFKEARVFVYKNFKKFIAKMKKIVNKVALEMIDNFVVYRTISKDTIKKHDRNLIRQIKFKRNEAIKKLNEILISYQDYIFKNAADDEEVNKSFNELLKQLNEIIHVDRKEEFSKANDLCNAWFDRYAMPF